MHSALIGVWMYGVDLCSVTFLDPGFQADYGVTWVDDQSCSIPFGDDRIVHSAVAYACTQRHGMLYRESVLATRLSALCGASAV